MIVKTFVEMRRKDPVNIGSEYLRNVLNMARYGGPPFYMAKENFDLKTFAPVSNVF